MVGVGGVNRTDPISEPIEYRKRLEMLWLITPNFFKLPILEHQNRHGNKHKNNPIKHIRNCFGK